MEASMIRILRTMGPWLIALASATACAQPWPSKPVRVVVAFTAGGTTDLLARGVGQQLSERVGHS
jgi:tripartite-type tricarboxylate transporter receptor subunit TctC